MVANVFLADAILENWVISPPQEYPGLQIVESNVPDVSRCRRKRGGRGVNRRKQERFVGRLSMADLLKPPRKMSRLVSYG
jgi:hypothetical protein